MFEFVPDKIWSKVFGRRSAPPTLSTRHIDAIFNSLLDLVDILRPGRLTQEERSTMGGCTFPEAPLLVLTMADSMRIAPWVFKEVEDPLALADEMEAGLRRGAALSRLSELFYLLGDLARDYALREKAAPPRHCLDLLEHDKHLRGAAPGRQRRRSVVRTQLDPDRERVMFMPRWLFSAWQRRIHGKRR